MHLTVAHAKGGVGKTTSSVFLAHALAEATGAPCALVDADPQASATQWAKLAAEAGTPLSVPVFPQPTSRLTPPRTPNVVIDTPAGDLDAIDAAIGLADLVLVPTSASALDLSRVQMTLDLAALRAKPAAVLLTRTRRTRSVATAEESLRSAGIRVLRTHVALREALALAFGRPVRQLHGYDLAIAELRGALPEQPYTVEAVRQRAGHTARPVARRPRPAVVYHAAVPAERGAMHVVAPPRPVALIDDEIVERLKTSMARLARQK